MSDDDSQKKLKKAYATATSKLRKAHQTEFNTLYSTEAKALGVEWKPKPTAEEKARAEMAALLEKYPQLRDDLNKQGEDA